MKNYFIILAAITVVYAHEQCPEKRNKVCGSNPPSCKRSRYRSYDGSCNNLIHPSWGTANKEYDRFIPAFYADGIHAFPRSITGHPLMNARDVSLKVFPGTLCIDKKWSLLTMQWGQIVAHDMSLTKDVPQTSLDDVICCINGEPIPPKTANTNPRCAPISLPKDDPYNAPEGYTCINFYRTKTNVDENCTVPGKTEQPVSILEPDLVPVLLCCEDLIVCCINGEPIPPRTNPRCAPITLPEDDPYNAPEGNTCINFYRTASNADKNCSVPGKTIDPLSEVTSFFDLSVLYGNNETRTNQIRTHVGGRLIYVKRNGQSWLPQSPNSTFACDNTRNAQEPCYYAGDIRVNQNPELAMLQILLLRYHNLIAEQLCDVINPHWNDERCFQETRRILIAIAQKITYYEFLYIFIGLKNMVELGLIYPNAKGYINDYNPKVNPQVLNEHSTAAWRFFHSLIAGSLEKFSPARRRTGQIRLSDWYNRPSVIEDDNNFCELAIGLATQHQNAADRFFDPEITQNFFKPLGSCTGGQDLRAIDIKRARDHGVGKYVDALIACGLSRPRCFADLEKYITRDRVKLLRRVYKSVHDVELAVGAALETHVNDTITPPTFLCIIKKQFYRTRVGDRYFFENGGEGAFTLAQLNSIRKATMSRLLCDTVKCVTRIQKDAFQKISEKNPLVDCQSLPQIDLRLWKEVPKK